MIEMAAKESPVHTADSDGRTSDEHFSYEPSEEDYEKARTVGIGNEPELPPGKVENGAVARAQVATDAASTQAVSRARSTSQRTDKS